MEENAPAPPSPPPLHNPAAPNPPPLSVHTTQSMPVMSRGATKGGQVVVRSDTPPTMKRSWPAKEGVSEETNNTATQPAVGGDKQPQFKNLPRLTAKSSATEETQQQQPGEQDMVEGGKRKYGLRGTGNTRKQHKEKGKGEPVAPPPPAGEDTEQQVS